VGQQQQQQRRRRLAAAVRAQQQQAAAAAARGRMCVCLMRGMKTFWWASGMGCWTPLTWCGGHRCVWPQGIALEFQQAYVCTEECRRGEAGMREGGCGVC
jgi:hypothetical protein